MEKKKIFYIIDGSGYIYRGYHAIRGLSNSEGLPTNAIFGFTNMLIKLMDDRKPEYAAMLFDMKGPTFRHTMYPDYKANRPPMPDDLVVQIQYIKDVTRGFNFPVVELGGYEADDLAGTLSVLAENAGFSVVMVTGDKDYLQLVTENALVWDTMKDKITDLAALRENFGVLPHQLIDVMGLSGDTSDNVPGVPGIGPKTALSLIQTWESMDRLYENIDLIKQKKQKENLINFKEQAYLSRQLVTIDTAVPLPFEFDADRFKLPEPDSAELSRLFRKLEFRQLQKAFPVAADLSKKEYRAVMTQGELGELIALLEKSGTFAIDTETTSENPMVAKIVGLSFSMEPDHAFYIPCGHEYLGAPEQLPLADTLERLRPILENPALKKTGQNIKYDWMVFLRHGINLAGVEFDTMLASYLLNPGRYTHGLDQIALDYLDHRMITFEDVAGKGKSAISFSQVPVDQAVTYACEDADMTLMARNALEPKLSAAGLSPLMEDVEMPLVPVLMKMEMHGVGVDEGRLRELSKLFEGQIDDMEQHAYALAGEEFNLRSSQQLGTILFEKLNLPVKKKTKKKTGYSTDVDVLTELAAYHELPAIVLRHRTIAKLKSTYTDALLDLVNKETGRIHTSYNQTVAATGRLSSSDPNLQNIPIRTDEGRQIRSAFIPRKDWLFLSADYSQIELRLLAHYSCDKILIDSFMDDEDIHTRTASEVFQTFPEMVTPELRRQAKAINFGIIYGMGAFGLANELGISRKMAKTYIDNYFRMYRGVREFLDRTTEEAREAGKTATLLGRIRFLPDIKSANKNVRSAAERIAVNTPIQGSAADLIKVAMIRVDAEMEKQHLKSKMLLSVHDELVFETPPEEADTLKALVGNIMENVWELSVPLKVNMDTGKNWMEAH